MIQFGHPQVPVRHVLPWIAITLLVGVTIPCQAGEPKLGPPEVQVEAGVGWLDYSDDEMEGTYGRTPIVGARLVASRRNSAEIFIGLQYAWDTGDPYYDVPELDSPATTHLHLLPIEVGFRVNVTGDPTFRFLLGVAIEYFRVWEQTYQGHDPVEGEPATFSDWGFALKPLGGPEWRISPTGSTIGLEFFWAKRQVDDPYSHYGRWAVDLTGPGARFYFKIPVWRGAGGEE